MRHAVSDNLFPYLCRCGTYHLTKQVQHQYVEALLRTAADMGRSHAAAAPLGAVGPVVAA